MMDPRTMLLGSFPPLTDSFDGGSLPIWFILSRDSGRPIPPVLRRRGRRAGSLTSRNARIPRLLKRRPHARRRLRQPGPRPR